MSSAIIGWLGTNTPINFLEEAAMEGEPLRILIVEDEGAHAAAIRRAFELAGAAAAIEVVSTLREFRNSVFDSPPDIALVDLVLPDGRALEILTQSPEDNPFPVLVMTSHGNEQVAVEAIKSGAMDYVVKSPEAFAAMPRTVERLWREWNLLKKRQQAEEALTLHNTRLQALLDLHLLTDAPHEQVLDFVLEMALKTMESEYCWIGMMDETESALTVERWSKTAMAQCTVANTPNHHPIALAGMWGNCIRKRNVIVVNDYQASHPSKKGIPAGHVAIQRFLVVPVFDGARIVAAAAVANKAKDYTEVDVRSFNSLLNKMWEILSRRQVEEAYRVLINNAPMGIFLVQGGKFKMLNPGCEKTTGFSARELLGTDSLSLVHRDYREMVRQKAIEMLKGKSGLPYEFPISTKSGEHIWVIEKVTSTVYQGNRATLGYFLDISEHKRLESQLLQAQKMESVARLAGGVAHDFNNMLGVILGHAEIAKMQVSVTEPLHHNLQEIHKAAERSADLTRQLLAFARQQTVQPQVLDLNRTLAGMLQMLHRLIGEDIDLVWVPGHDLWKVKIDPSQIDQILANLVVNARDAIGGGGKITIETDNVVIGEEYCADHREFVSGEYVLLAVSDDGCGMAQETLAQIFEPFYTTKGVGEGTGLGLATVYGIVKQNDGFINLYSEPGHGTTFKIYLPRCQAEGAQDRAETAEKPFPRGSETVLIVEDEKALMEFGKEVLEKLGYTMLIAATPGEAIRLVGEHAGDIHLLITDVVLPEMNGHELAQILIAMKPRLKCLYMSGYTANVIAHRGVLDEGVTFIQKPFSVKTLAAKVREVLEG
jgi:two-component system, cell cycle sensor histidine kinase and response regulator CckA